MAPDPDLSHRFPTTGDVLEGKYRIEGRLGEGGMSAVMRATHLVRHALVALKFLGAEARRHPGAEERFVNEAVAASRIESDHVVKIFDVCRLPDGTPYLVMELLEGSDLDALREREGPRLPLPRAVHFALQILRALQTAHAAGVVHRDMKPSNCLVIDKDGEADFVKVIDFGISKVKRPEDDPASLTRSNVVFGTPLYMSPEQAQSSRDVDLRTDLYSAGAILYELLSGRTPFTAESGGSILHQLWTATPDPLKTVAPHVPDALAGAVHRALARQPEARFGSAVEMAQALAPFADGRSAVVLGWLLGSRGRSLVPAGFASMRPAGSDGVVTPDQAMAKTAPRAEGGGAVSPMTDMGVGRESKRDPRPARRLGRFILAALAGALMIGTWGAWLHEMGRGDSMGGTMTATTVHARAAAAGSPSSRGQNGPSPLERVNEVPSSSAPSALPVPVPAPSAPAPSPSAPPALVASPGGALSPAASNHPNDIARSRAREDGLR